MEPDVSLVETPNEPKRLDGRSRRLFFVSLGVAATIGVAIVASLGAPDFAKASDPPKAPPPPQPLPVQVHVLATESFAPTINGTGELLPNEVVEVSSELSRKLVAIHIQDGQVVKQGDLLFELDRKDLEAQLVRLRVQSRFARASYSRFDSLVTSGSVSKEERDLSRLRLDEAQAMIGELEVQLERTRVTAPFAGTFGLRPMSLGAWVSPGTPLGRLSDVSKLKLDFQLPERYAQLVAPGTEVRFKVDGRPDGFKATVTAIDSAIDRASRSVVVRALVAEPLGLLPGTFASVELVLASRETLFIPSIAVIPSPTGTHVFVEENGKSKQVKVELGQREPNRVEVVKGLAPGAKVITTNLLRIRNGSPVRILTPESPAAAPAKPGSPATPPKKGDGT